MVKYEGQGKSFTESDKIDTLVKADAHTGTHVDLASRKDFQ
jgi:hypothetical protein